MCGWLRYASAQETQWSYVQNTFSGHCPRLLDDKMESQFGFQILRLSCSGTKYRFSAFWLRSKCSICSYQLNIWYETHVVSLILNWFLSGDRVQELAPALSRVGLVLQYHQDWPTVPTQTKWQSCATAQVRTPVGPATLLQVSPTAQVSNS